MSHFIYCYTKCRYAECRHADCRGAKVLTWPRFRLFILLGHVTISDVVIGYFRLSLVEQHVAVEVVPREEHLDLGLAEVRPIERYMK